MKRVKKKGQVTIFIIISILIIAGVVLFFTLKEDTNISERESIEVDPEIEPIYNYIQSCLDSASEDVVYAVGIGGGYYDIKEKESTQRLGVTYHLNENKNLVPSKKEIESEISKNTEIQTQNCSSDLDSEFTDYQIKQKNISVETTIKQEEVLIEADFPLLIKKGDSIYEIRKFRKIIPVKFGTIHEASSEFIQEEEESQEGIFVSSMTGIASKHSLEFNVFQIDKEGEDFIFMVTPEGEINNKTFIYSFAIKY